MIRTLQKKFIVTAMTAITVLLAVLLGGVNVINAWSSSREADQLLNALVQMEAQGRKELHPRPEPESASVSGEPDNIAPGQGSEPEGQPPEFPLPEGLEARGGFLTGPLTEDDRLSALYCTARVRDGTVVSTDVSRISSVSQAEVISMTEAVLASGLTEGRMDSFRYASQTDNQGQTVYVFLEYSTRRANVLRVAVLSALAGFAGWGLMLLLVILLSKKAIAPIAANMERQRQFVTDAGHELKTPLAIIQANTEAMELISGQTKWSRNIKAQVVRLTDLTRNLLTLARAEELPTEGSFAEVDLSAAVEQTVQMFRAPAELRSLELETAITPGLRVRGNAGQLSSLCSILMDNAVKYATPGSTIRLECAQSDKSVLLRTENNCDRLPDCPPDQLFDRFYRGDSARTQKSGGFGIGLSAASVIVQQHKGSLEAEYLDESRIAFSVTLPM